MFNWQGRTDTEDGEHGLRWHQKVNQPGTHKLSSALVGFPCDLGVIANKGRVGASEGPNSIRQAMANLPWHWQADLIDMHDTVVLESLSSAQHNYAFRIAEALTHHNIVLGLGGGHEMAWGSYLGLVQHIETTPHNRIGIINFDAHFDLRKPSPHASSGTPFRQIAEHCRNTGLPFDYTCLGVAKSANTPALFEFAESSGTRYLLDRDCQFDQAKALLTPMLEAIDQLYVTICLDAFPASIAPGVSAPSSLGVSTSFVIETLHWLASQQAILGFNWQLCDIAEMNPTFDIDNRTAKLAARLAFEVVDGIFSFKSMR